MAPSFWQRPVSPRALLWVGTGVLGVWLLGLAVAVWVLYAIWEVHYTLRDQPVLLRLASGLQAQAAIDLPVQTTLDWHPSFTVPVRQDLRLRMQDSFSTQVRVRTHLPLETTVELDHVVQVQTQVDLMMNLRSWLPRVPVSVPVTVKLPVHLRVPVKADVPLDLVMQVSGEWPETLVVPIDTSFEVRTHLQAPLSVQVRRLTQFAMLAPDAPMALDIAEARLRLPFELSLRPGAKTPD